MVLLQSWGYARVKKKTDLIESIKQQNFKKVISVQETEAKATALKAKIAERTVVPPVTVTLQPATF